MVNKLVIKVAEFFLNRFALAMFQVLLAMVCGFFVHKGWVGQDAADSFITASLNVAAGIVAGLLAILGSLAGQAQHINELQMAGVGVDRLGRPVYSLDTTSHAYQAGSPKL